MTDEKNDLVPVTILVDLSDSKSLRLDYVCARCGAKVRGTPTCYESLDRETGKNEGNVFFVRSASFPEGWDRIRVPSPENPYGKSVDVCGTCISKFMESR